MVVAYPCIIVAPGAIAVQSPVAVAFLLGKDTRKGMQVLGATIMGAFIAFFMAIVVIEGVVLSRIHRVLP